MTRKPRAKAKAKEPALDEDEEAYLNAIVLIQLRLAHQNPLAVGDLRRLLLANDDTRHWRLVSCAVVDILASLLSEEQLRQWLADLRARAMAHWDDLEETQTPGSQP